MQAGLEGAGGARWGRGVGHPGAAPFCTVSLLFLNLALPSPAHKHLQVQHWVKTVPPQPLWLEMSKSCPEPTSLLPSARPGPASMIGGTPENVRRRWGPLGGQGSILARQAPGHRPGRGPEWAGPSGKPCPAPRGGDPQPFGVGRQGRWRPADSQGEPLAGEGRPGGRTRAERSPGRPPATPQKTGQEALGGGRCLAGAPCGRLARRHHGGAPGLGSRRTRLQVGRPEPGGHAPLRCSPRGRPGAFVLDGEAGDQPRRDQRHRGPLGTGLPLHQDTVSPS